MYARREKNTKYNLKPIKKVLTVLAVLSISKRKSPNSKIELIKKVKLYEQLDITNKTIMRFLNTKRKGGKC